MADPPKDGLGQTFDPRNPVGLRRRLVDAGMLLKPGSITPDLLSPSAYKDTAPVQPSSWSGDPAAQEYEGGRDPRLSRSDHNHDLSYLRVGTDRSKGTADSDWVDPIQNIESGVAPPFEDASRRIVTWDFDPDRPFAASVTEVRAAFSVDGGTNYTDYVLVGVVPPGQDYLIFNAMQYDWTDSQVTAKFVVSVPGNDRGVTLKVLRSDDTGKLDIGFVPAGPANLHSGAGSPEGVLAAPVGDGYLDTTNGTFYVKRTGTGNTGWLIYATRADVTADIATHAGAADPHGDRAYSDGQLAGHTGDGTDAHDASAISNVPAGAIAATDVQAAINELDTDKEAAGTAAAAVVAHEAASDPHAGYQKESEKGSASGYAGLDAGGLLDRSDHAEGPDRVYRNAGSPEGVVTAAVGSICLDTTNGAVYEKRTGAGNTGWLRLVPTDDSRMTDARTPTAHKASHESGGTDVLASFTGDSGAGGAAGYVPAPAAGDAAAGKYLKASGAWVTPPAGGGSTPTGTGFRHVTADVEDAATKLVESADVHSNLKDPAAATAGLRTLGTGAQAACAGNDGRLSDSRAPTGSAGGDLGGTYPNPTVSAPGRLRAVYVYATGTGATHTPAAGTTALRVVAVGGGGGGGGGDGNGAAGGCGGGGGAGGYCDKTIFTAPTLTFSVGALGGGGAAGPNAGTAGGDTTVSGTGISLTAKGGTAGGTMVAGTGVTKVAGSAATAGTTGGDINIEGAGGFWAMRTTGITVMAGAGGNGPLGFGGQPGALTSAGGAATGYGGGGAGGSVSAAGADQAGGNGTVGVVIVWEFY